MKPRRWRRNKYSTSTHDTSGKEKFEGAADEMKGNVFSIGKHQADTYTTTMNALVIQVGTKYSAIVAAAIKELKVKPSALKLPVTPVLSDMIADGTLPSGTTAVPQNYKDLYTEKMKAYAKTEERFERQCMDVYQYFKGQCSPFMISELKGFDEYVTIEEEMHLVNLLKLIKKICFNYKTQDNDFYAHVSALGDLMSTRQRKDESVDDWALATENRLNVYTAMGGSVLAPGLTTLMSRGIYNKEYITLTVAEKTAVDKATTERLMAMILFKNSCSERFEKLHKEIHDDHLKSVDKSVSKY